MLNQRSSTGKNLRSHARRLDRIAKKRQDADARNDKWASLSPADQLVSLNTRGESAMRQRARIKVVLGQ